MSDPGPRNGEDGDKAGPDTQADLSARLERLGTRLGEASSRRADGAGAGPRRGSDMSGLGKALRFSAEFIAGVFAGTLVGWAVDQAAGTTPFGMIVGLILGFCAGMLNIMRAAGELNRAPRSGKPPGERPQPPGGESGRD